MRANIPFMRLFEDYDQIFQFNPRFYTYSSKICLNHSLSMPYENHLSLHSGHFLNIGQIVSKVSPSYRIPSFIT